jgi:choline kinase
LKLVIIAAGQGKRIRSITEDLPKTLLKINGRTLLETLLENCLYVGISDVVVVTGYQTKAIEGFINNLRMDLNIQTVYNPDWNLENGMSILAAKDTISAHETFIVSMSDHFYGPDLLEQVMKINLGNNTACVALDFNKDDIFDIDDGMKISVEKNNKEKIIKMSKTLDNYDAIDCGVFKFKYSFFSTLDNARKTGKFSISEACQMLIKIGEMGGVNIGNSFWLDIDTPEAVHYLKNTFSS